MELISQIITPGQSQANWNVQAPELKSLHFLLSLRISQVHEEFFTENVKDLHKWEISQEQSTISASGSIFPLLFEHVFYVIGISKCHSLLSSAGEQLHALSPLMLAHFFQFFTLARFSSVESYSLL